jgi:Zn-dependent protease with chaperone function
MSGAFLAHGLTLALAWFFIVNAAMCVAAGFLTAALLRGSSRRSATFWIALRLLPATTAIAFVAAVFVPSYLAYEPREFVEGFDASLAAVAIAGAAILVAGCWRGAQAWWSAAGRTSAWMRHASPLAIGGALPAYAIDVDQPLIALVGVLRPRLLVTRGLIDALTPSELEAAVGHEFGHLRGRDNLKRLAMRAAPDLLAGWSCFRSVERRWAAAAEHVADRIGCGDAAARCALASALVKVARLTPPSLPVAEPISALIAGGDIASRIRTLLDDGDAGFEHASRASRWLASAAAIGAAAGYTPLLLAVHEVTELIVRTL